METSTKKQGIAALEKLTEYTQTKGLTLPKIIFSTTIQDKKNILSKGADFYLPKPYDINTLIRLGEKAYIEPV